MAFHAVSVSSSLLHAWNLPRCYEFWYQYPMTAELHALLQRHLAACECAATLLLQVISFDVKPGNILLDITQTIAKLSDMGLAKLQTQSLNTLVSWNKKYAWLTQQILSLQHGVLLWAM